MTAADAACSFFVSRGFVDDEKYDGVLGALRDLHTTWQEYQKQMDMAIGEYKRTVNSALTFLGQEALKHQTDTKQRLEADAIERRARQAVVDTATANVREDMLASRAETLARLDATNVQNDAREKRNSHKSLLMLGSLGCLIAVNVLALIALAAVLIVQNWR